MIGLNNADKSFFKIDSDDTPFKYGLEYLTEAVERDVISFTVVEEVGKITSGSLSLYDPSNLYASLFRVGLTLKLSWGYTGLDTNVRTALALKNNPTEAGGSFSREGMRAYVMSPSGAGDEKGFTTFNCNFYGTEFSKEKERKVHTSGTKASVVHDVMLHMGVSTMEIIFTKGTEIIRRDTQIIQRESDFKFLQRCARDWRCIFRVGYTPAGTLYGLFIDYDKFNLTAFQKVVTGAAFGNSIYFDYKQGAANVRSYTWKNHVGDSTGGDHIRMVVINGQTTFIRYVAENETVTAYRFCPEKVDEELRRRITKGGVAEATKFASWAMSVKNFNEIKDYFTSYDESTAPQGLGFSVSVNVLGNPLITPPIEAKFGTGFPDILESSQFKLFVKKVTHSITRGGYFCSAEIVDTLTFTGGSFVV